MGFVISNDRLGHEAGTYEIKRTSSGAKDCEGDKICIIFTAVL